MELDSIEEGIFPFPGGVFGQNVLIFVVHMMFFRTY